MIRCCETDSFKARIRALLRHLYILLMILIPTSCSLGTSPELSPSPIAVTDISSPTVPSQLVSTPSAVPASPLPSPTEAQLSCPSSAAPDSSWVFSGPILATLSNKEGYWAIEGPDKGEHPLSWIAGRPYMSPQGENVAFVERSPSLRLVIAGISGQEKASIDWRPEWGNRPDGWFNEDWIRLQRSEETPLAVRLVSPWTGQLQVLEPQLPNLHPDAASQYAAATYSPDLDLVIYMRLEEGTAQGQFALWDLRQDKLIWHSESDIRQSHAMFTFSAWSPDGNMIAVTDSQSEYAQRGLRRQDIVVLTRDGQVAARTDFLDEFKEYWIGRDLFWSPDGKEVAFWMLPLDGDSLRAYQLYLLHVETNRLVDLCVQNDDIPGAAWSPDGEFLAAIGSVAEQKSLVILDPADGTSLTLPSIEPLELIGWAASP